MTAFLMMGGLGLLIGIGLAAASKIFYVYVDPLVMSIDDALPGANCGGCGLPGCSSNAEAIAVGKAGPDSCVAGGEDLTAAIAELMGVTVEAKEADIARPGCTYSVEKAEVKYLYDGLNDCRAASLLNGGMKECKIGCLGLGTCVKACKFGALEIGSEGLPIVDQDKCTGCGACEKSCPKNIINLSSVTRRIIREYTIEDCTTPCQRSCPAGINISEYISQIAKGDFHKAVQVIKERNPFPTVIGRICPRPCEFECRRKYIDEPVAINFLKRFAADYERDNNERILPFKAPATGRKIAVIGGGVEGLSAAFFSARLGHEPTVFEASSQLGGLLRNAIASNRLPQDTLDWDIEGVFEMGVNVETGKALGKDVSIDSLLGEGFEAVFIASGGWDNRLARGAGSEVEELIPGTYLLIDFMGADKNNGKIKCGKDVVIAGGGELTLDVIKSCKQLGAEKITVLFNENIENTPVDESTIKNIESEGAVIVYGAGISRITGEGGDLSELEYTVSTGERKTIPANTLVIASGRFPELIFLKNESDESGESGESDEMPSGKTIKWVGVESCKSPADDSGLLSKGGPLTDFSAAIKAISAGRKGAASLHQLLYGIELYNPDQVIRSQTIIQNVDQIFGVMDIPREIMPLNYINDSELEQGFTKKQAKKEAERCLECGLVCYKHSEDTLQYKIA